MSFPFESRTQNPALRAPFDAGGGGGFSSNRTLSGTGPGRPLGTKREFVEIPSSTGKGRKAPERKNRKNSQKKKGKLSPDQLAERQKLELRARHADQREASRIMWAHSTDGRPGGVTFCRWTLQYQVEEVEVIRETVPDAPARSFLKGLSKCDLGWVCPICTAAKAEKAREQLNALLSRGRREGWRMVMVTLTVRHDADMPFAWLWERISVASDELRRSHAWRKLNKLLIGSAKAVEATHGVNGWHPHYHVILVFPPGLTEEEALAQAETLRGAWMDQLRAQGLTGNERAFHVQGAAAAGNYLTKWGAAEEISLGHAKAGRPGQRSPWQLLRASREGDHEAGELWYEFVTAIKGTHQIRLTPGLRALVKEELAFLEERKQAAIDAGDCPPEPVPHQVSLARIGSGEWEKTGRHRRVMIREAAAARTRKEAEKAVWEARHSAETDSDLLNPPVIDDDEAATARPDDEPEALLADYKSKKRREEAAARPKLTLLDQALTDLAGIPPPDG
jgi:hypothetical protein